MNNNPIERIKAGGAWVPSVTIFYGGKSRRVNTQATTGHITNLNRHGAEGVVINGTTGEGHLLRHSDKLALIQAVGDAKKSGRIKSDFVLISGVGTENVEEANEVATMAIQNGFDGLLTLPPKQGSQKHYFSQLAETCGNKIAIMLYHHPRLEPNYSVTPELLAELMDKFPCVVGVKDSSGDKKLLYRWTKNAPNALLAIGEDFFVAEGLQSAGAKAAIAGAANTPKGLHEFKTIFAAWRKHDFTTMNSAQARFDREINSLLKTGLFRNNAKRRRIR